MHPNQQLLNKLFACLNAKDHEGMADCYHKDAKFKDIAFELTGREQIHAMWRMICTPDGRGRETGIKVIVESVKADDKNGQAVVEDNYTFRLTGKQVKNKITSTLDFAEGKIIKQVDDCNVAEWSRLAYAGLWTIPGLLLGRNEFTRRRLAMRKLRKFDPAAFRKP